MPALRERQEDIPLLVRHFVHKFATRMGRDIETIPKETMKALIQWNWPGNVREFENLAERSVILSEGTVLRVPLEEIQVHDGTSSDREDHTLGNTERQHIIRILKETHGVISGTNGAAQASRIETNHLTVQDAPSRHHSQRLSRRN